MENLFTQSQVYNLFNYLFVSQYGFAVSLFEVNIFKKIAKGTNLKIFETLKIIFQCT